VLTTGFDATNIDCIALVRPTMSPGLYYQMVGRGFRIHPDKENCLILDFGGNVMRHGPVDMIRTKNKKKGTGEAPAKECPECHSIIAAGYSNCPDCGYAFPKRENKNINGTATEEGVISGVKTTHIMEVRSVYYAVHTKRNAPEDAPKTMRVEYEHGFASVEREWICFEHTGWARQKAESWWKQRSNTPAPNNSQDAVNLANAGALAKTTQVTVEHISGEKFNKIIDHIIGDKPALEDIKEVIREKAVPETKQEDDSVEWETDVFDPLMDEESKALSTVLNDSEIDEDEIPF